MEPQHPTKKNLMITLVCILIVAGLIILGLRSSKQPSDGTEVPTPIAVEWPSKEVRKEFITESTPVYAISAEYPVTGRGDITALMQSFVQDAVDSFKRDAAGMPEGFRQITLDVTYEEMSSSIANNYTFHIYSDTGGAHGIQATRTFSFDKAGNRIELTDLFTSEPRGIQLVSEYVKKELLKRPFADSQWISEGAAPTEDNYQVFVVTDTGVTFLFDPYQVASYAAGPQTVAVPVSAFKAYANTELFR